MVIVAGATAAAAGVAVAAPEPPPAPAPPSVRADGDLDAQLEAARKGLEQAAHEVAQLSSQLSGPVLQQVMPFEPGHAIMGVQLEPATGTAGARVREVSPGGPAAEAGIHVGDVIVAGDGPELEGREPARPAGRLMRGGQPGGTRQPRVVRHRETRAL